MAFRFGRAIVGRLKLAGWGLALGVLSVAGLPLAIVGGSGLRWFADLHRLWSTRVMGVPIARPYGSASAVADRRDRVWALVNAAVGWVLFGLPAALLLGGVYALDYPLAHRLPQPVLDQLRIEGVFVRDNDSLYWTWALVPFLLLGFWALTGPVLRVYAQLTRYLLAPAESVRLADRVAVLTESRADTVDAQAAELRRIERDLHDGAQARLVSLGMSLGLADTVLEQDPAAARRLLAEARESTGVALAELRDLVRGIHPPVLADRGLDGAVRALAMTMPVPVEVSIDLPGRLPAPVESAAYFAVAEALANVAKHSNASSAWLRLSYTDGRLGLMIGDDGWGGARPHPGGGLDGLSRRLGAFDGSMTVASPAGGPTIVTMELPCQPVSV